MSSVNRANRFAIRVFASLTIAAAGCRGPQMASRVDPTSIRTVEIGMTEQQVTAILGQPLRSRPWGDGSFVYDYAVQGWASSSPVLWIYFENRVVHTVQAKRHRILGEDQTVYEARADRPNFESPDFVPTFTRTR
jgi:outer membrane protein assembly factor BamE (lipoprotein component of BamABCDE complex)